MTIKSTRRLEPGMTFDYEYVPEAGSPNVMKGRKKIKTELVIIEVYSHFVLCRQTQRPHLKFSITNNELYQMGLYNESDFEKEFRR